MKYHHLFGPVQSRRFGRSLGIDLIPFKTCSLDCVFCECGKTTCLTTKRQDYVSTDEVIRELKDFLKNNPEIDFLTFSGAGEPTLASNIGTIIDFLKDNYPQYKVCVLTNGTLLWDPLVRKRLLRADVVVPSLNSAIPETYLKINRPVKQLRIDKIIEGIIEFRSEFKGKIYLEIFIIPGLNDTIDELTALKKVAEQIKPELIQLNSLDRVGTESWVKRPSLEQMEKIKEFFKPIPTEIFVKPKEVPLQPRHERSAGKNQTA